MAQKKKVRLSDIAAKLNISSATMAKMGKGQDVRVETLVKICSVLNCTIDDIMEIIPDPEEN